MSVNTDPEMMLKMANSLTDLVGVCKLETTADSSSSRPVVERESFELKSYCNEMALSQTQRAQIFGMFETNMKAQYEQNWGWKEDKMRNEVFHPMSRYLCLYPKDNEDELAGYVIFRFEWDDDEEPEYPVLYCYQLMVSAEKQRHGLGRHLMSLLSTIGKKLRMEKVMLTVFNSNTESVEFYKRIGFAVDENSPSTCGFPAEYEILSKVPK